MLVCRSILHSSHNFSIVACGDDQTCPEQPQVWDPSQGPTSFSGTVFNIDGTVGELCAHILYCLLHIVWYYINIVMQIMTMNHL